MKRKCERCGFSNPSKKITLDSHHIIPNFLGLLSMENKEVILCRRCHQQLHALYEKEIIWFIFTLKGKQFFLDLAQEFLENKETNFKTNYGISKATETIQR